MRRSGPHAPAATTPVVYLAVAAVLAVGLAGCGSSAGPATDAAFGSPKPYTLLTHCGIDWVVIDGRWYEASRPLSDGQGNPPHGWGNPDQPGTITLTSPTSAVFRDSAGHRVGFVLRPGATGPPYICS